MSLLFRYLTRMQMIQFVIVFLHALQTLYYDCNYPRIIPKVRLLNGIFIIKSSQFQLQTLNMVIFFVLFGNYYFYAYINKKKKYQ